MHLFADLVQAHCAINCSSCSRRLPIADPKLQHAVILVHTCTKPRTGKVQVVCRTSFSVVILATTYHDISIISSSEQSVIPLDEPRRSNIGSKVSGSNDHSCPALLSKTICSIQGQSFGYPLNRHSVAPRAFDRTGSALKLQTIGSKAAGNETRPKCFTTGKQCGFDARMDYHFFGATSPIQDRKSWTKNELYTSCTDLLERRRHVAIWTGASFTARVSGPGIALSWPQTGQPAQQSPEEDEQCRTS